MIGAVIRALENTQFRVCRAESDCLQRPGGELLAGGVPGPGGAGRDRTVTIRLRIGIRLTHAPRGRHPTEVAPEVSALDFANGVTLGGFRIPALTTRRAQTDVELRDGQTFAIAGLLNNISQDDKAAIPYLSKIPIIGNLFKSKAERAEQAELMVLITPRLVRALDPDEVPPLPTRFKPFMTPKKDREERQGQWW